MSELITSYKIQDLRMAGGINVSNVRMQQAAECCGRHAEYVVYTQQLDGGERL
jgi:hypothetical protein